MPEDQKRDEVGTFPAATCSARWRHTTYGSGTQTVSPEGSFAGAHYHIGHLAADNAGDHGRHDVGKELCEWLNGGKEPWWLDMLHRDSANYARTPHGCEISACGPMIDRATPPQWGEWWTDDSDDAKITRGLMIDALLKRDRSIVPNAKAQGMQGRSP